VHAAMMAPTDDFEAYLATRRRRQRLLPFIAIGIFVGSLAVPYGLMKAGLSSRGCGGSCSRG